VDRRDAARSADYFLCEDEEAEGAVLVVDPAEALVPADLATPIFFLQR
jgi:hypothetical protein